MGGGKRKPKQIRQPKADRLVALFGGDGENNGIGRGIGLRTEACLDPLAGDKNNVLDQAHFFHEPDGPCGGVRLLPAHPVAGGAGEGVVVVVPAFAHGEDAEEEVIPALVGGVELATAESMTDRIHGPRDVLVKEETNKAAPYQAGEGAEPDRLPHQVGRSGADEGGDGETDKNPKPKGVMDKNNDGVLQHGSGVFLDIGLKVVENPADMGVPETLQRGVGILFLVRVGVVLGVGGSPVEGGTLHGHGSGDEEKGFEPRVRLKGLVSQHPVEPESDAKGTDCVHGKKQSQIHPVHPAIPKESDGTDDPENREPNQGQKDEFGEGRGRVGVTDGCAQAVSFAYIPKGGKRSPKIYWNCCKSITGKE